MSPGARYGSSPSNAPLTYVRSAGVAVLLLRSSHTDEVDLRARGLSHVSGEPEVARRDARGQDLLQSWLEERRLTLGKRVDLALVDVDADDLMTDRCHRRSVYRPEVTTTDDRQLHGSSKGDGA